jgi:hypothetical protein
MLEATKRRTNMKYKVGDKVRITTDKSKSNNWNSSGRMDKWLGKVMTIRHVGCNSYRMEEDRGEPIACGWYWYDEMIDGLATEDPKHQITITSDGKTTTAVFTVDGREVKKGVAKCSPEDKFNFKFGAELALERMWGKAEPKEKHWYFSKEKYYSIGDNKIKDLFFKAMCGETWVDECDGKVANFDTNNVGHCGLYKIHKKWCEYR